MSAALQNGTRFVTAPVAGLVISPERLAEEPIGLPPIQRGTVSAASTGLFMGDLLQASALGPNCDPTSVARASRYWLAVIPPSM